ncbi:MAG TPA: apolipoprotein N-acyltransferase, partial [Terriglobales bacterium]|nr:apolipoprotein N-acyltransferase [Terriglobales bacterium]
MRRIPQSAWLLAALSGVLQILCFPSPSLYFVSWFAVTPLLLAILGPLSRSGPQLVDEKGRPLGILSAGQGFWLGYLSGVLWYAGTCFWVYHSMHVYGGLDPAVSTGILILFCLYLALYHGLFGALLAKSAQGSTGSKRAILLTPFLWVLVELARARVTGFPWDLLGTAQVDNIPLAQLGRFTGVYGISFGIMMVNAAFAAAFLLPRHARRTLLASSMVAAAVLQLGSLVDPPGLPAAYSARLVQQNIPIETAWDVPTFRQTLQQLRALSVPPGPALVIWPESPAPFYLTDPIFREEVTAVAVESHAFVIAGSLGTPEMHATEDRGKLYNSAALVTPAGTWTARYDKVHLVPFGEYVPFKSVFGFAEKLTRAVGDFSPGTQRTVFAAGGQKVGVFICYESVFPDEIREFARNGAQVFVNISNDGWFGEYGAPGQHLNMARMRAIENERWVLRATNTG